MSTILGAEVATQSDDWMMAIIYINVGDIGTCQSVRELFRRITLEAQNQTRSQLKHKSVNEGTINYYTSIQSPVHMTPTGRLVGPTT